MKIRQRYKKINSISGKKSVKKNCVEREKVVLEICSKQEKIIKISKDTKVIEKPVKFLLSKKVELNIRYLEEKIPIKRLRWLQNWRNWGLY